MALSPSVDADNFTVHSGIAASDIVRVNFGGTLTVGDVVGFRYRFTSGGTNYDEVVSYAVQAGDAWPDVMWGVLASLRANANIDNAWTADGCPENMVTANYYHINGNQIVFNQSWPLVLTSIISAHLSAGATETVEIISLGDTLEGYPFHAIGRDVPGRGLKPNDYTGGLLFYGPDSSGGPYPYILAANRRGFPYITLAAQIKNAMYGAWDAVLHLVIGNNASVITFCKNKILIDGKPCASSADMAALHADSIERRRRPDDARCGDRLL